jgi:hypothetical protein
MAMTYEECEKIRAAAWKHRSNTLPATARVPAPYVGKDGQAGSTFYDFCLPPAYATLSLLPEVREAALALFAELEIPWHAGAAAGPSNHLLSSQVQCVNALGQMVEEPSRLVSAFGDLFGIGEVLEIEPGRFLTFEYIGEEDLLHEAVGGKRTRGAYSTSIDAAFLHRATDGVVELVLVEWKYTEKYALRATSPAKNAVRLKRYGTLLADPTGPIRNDLLSFDHLTDEPFYQLVRQQLLAHALESNNPYGAGRCRVVHVTPAGNTAYQASLARAEHQALGSSVGQVWQQLLRLPDRFTSMDSGVFLDPAITSREYSARYAEDVVWDVPTLLSVAGYEDVAAFEDLLDFDGDTVVVADGVELGRGRETTLLPYPFAMTELCALIAELEAVEDCET